MQRINILGVCLLSLFIGKTVQAQNNIVASSLDSILIKENRIQTTYGNYNKNIGIIDSKQISVLPVRSVNELLSYAAGVDLRQRGPFGTQSDIGIDGSTFDQVLVLINGVKMSDPQTGHPLLNIPIPLSSIHHIEILRGSAARIYGVNALAGAINIITKIPVTNDISAQMYAGSSFKTDTATGNAYYGWGANASGALNFKKQSHIFSIAHDEGNGYRHNTAFNAYRLFYQNTIKLDTKNSIEAMGGYIVNEFGANGFYSAPKDAESNESVQTVLGSVGYKYQPNSRVTIRPRICYRYNNDDYIFIRQKPEVYHNIHETNVVTAEVQSIISIQKGIIGAGAELRNEQIQSTNLGKRSRDNLGLYAEYKHQFSTKFTASAGLYANYSSDYDWAFFPGVDAGYQLASNWKIYANASTGQRLPTYTDLYYKGPSNIGNTELKPEEAYFGEIGMRCSYTAFSGKVGYFYRHITNFIDWIRTTDTNPWQPNNFQSINTPGLSAGLGYDLNKHFVFPAGFQSVFSASYTYLHPVIEAPGTERSKYTIEALRHQVVITSANRIHNNILLNLNARYQYRINTNDYTLLDARIGFNINRWTIYADVNNILDTEYKEIGAVPLPGRWFTAGLKLNGIK